MSDRVEDVTGKVSERRRPGRRRDASIDGKLMRAALECYARNGWSSFTFEAVAREARVGKPAVYLRWALPIEMLEAAFETMSKEFVARDHGSFRDDLTEWGLQLFQWWDSPVGVTFSRLQVEHRYHPQLRRPYFDLVARPLAHAARDIVRRAVQRGEIEETVNENLLLEVINGAIFTRVTTQTPESRRERAAAERRYLARLVELVLVGAGMDLSEE